MIDETFEYLYAERERLLKLIDQEEQRNYMDSTDMIGMYQRWLSEIETKIQDLRDNT